MMPEGPEVSAVVDNINYNLQANSPWSLTGINFVSGRYGLHNPPNGHDNLLKLLPLTLDKVYNKGKFIYFTFEKNVSIWSTLGLTGWWTFSDHDKNIRFALIFERKNDNQCLKLYYFDQIGYGTLSIHLEDEELKNKLSSLGPCWIRNRNELTFQMFLKIVCKQRNSKRIRSPNYLAKFLMNQKFTSGIGNYILSEVLYKCCLHPYTRLPDIEEEEEWRSLFLAIQDTVWSSYNSQSVVRRHAVDNSSQFQMLVYYRDFCPLGNAVKRETGPHGRTVHWVPSHQYKYKPLEVTTTTTAAEEDIPPDS